MEECLLSQRILDELGYSEYWDNNGISGDRILSIGSNQHIVEIVDETKDQSDGYSNNPEYISEHTINKKDYSKLFFVSDLVKVIRSEMSNKFNNEFNIRLKNINLGRYI